MARGFGGRKRGEAQEVVKLYRGDSWYVGCRRRGREEGFDRPRWYCEERLEVVHAPPFGLAGFGSAVDECARVLQAPGHASWPENGAQNHDGLLRADSSDYEVFASCEVVLRTDLPGVIVAACDVQRYGGPDAARPHTPTSLAEHISVLTARRSPRQKQPYTHRTAKSPSMAGDPRALLRQVGAPCG